LRDIVRDRAGFGIPESVLETLALRLLKRFGLPSPVRQHETSVSGRFVRFDLAYPEMRIAIELDGRSAHAARWQSDHDRDNATELAAWRLLRFTWDDITQRPLYVAVSIAEALGLDPARWKAAT
jgi:very-short-patch-repair endonuclease